MCKRFTIISLTVLVALSSIIGCSQKLEEKIIAKIGDKTITLKDFERRFRPRAFSSEEEEKAEKMKILDVMIEEKLFAIAGMKEGMAEEAAKSLKDYPDRLAVNELYQEVVVKKANISELEITKTYRQMGRELHGRHLLSKTKEEAENIYKELTKKNAANFAELAKKSLDPKTRDKAGDMGWFSWGKMDPEQQEVAYKLKKGKISKPFQTRFGWDILQIVDERERKQKPLVDERENITQSLKRIKMTKIANDYLENLKKRARINWDTTVINLLVEKSPKGKQQNPFQPAPLPVLTEDEGKMVIVTSILGKMTVSELLETAAKQQRRPPFNTQDMVKKYIEGNLMNDMLINQAKRMHLYKSNAVKKQYNDALDSRIAGEYRKKKITARDIIPDEELKNYYVEHRDKYKVEEKRNTKIVVVSTKKEADEVYKTLKSGGNFETIAKEKSNHFSKNHGGKFGPYTKKRFPKGYGEKAFTLKRGKLSEPFKTKDGFVIMKVINIEPESYLEYENLKNRIQNDIKNEEKEETKKELLENLRKEIPVVINEDVLLIAGKKKEEQK